MDVKCKLLRKQFRSDDPEMYFSERNVKEILVLMLSLLLDSFSVFSPKAHTRDAT